MFKLMWNMYVVKKKNQGRKIKRNNGESNVRMICDAHIRKKLFYVTIVES